jgi:hypothetical protein
MNKNLPCWKRFSKELKKGKSAKDFGFECKDGEISRINARYRLVKSFKGLELDGYSQTTLQKYNSLFKIFLAYSLFEVYLKKALGVRENFYIRAYELLGKRGEELSKKISKYKKFYEFLYEYLDKNHKREVEKFLEGREYNVIYLISSIRHIFSHGILPASKLEAPKRITKAIVETIMGFVEEDFAKKICKGMK